MSNHPAISYLYTHTHSICVCLFLFMSISVFLCQYFYVSISVSISICISMCLLLFVVSKGVCVCMTQQGEATSIHCWFQNWIRSCNIGRKRQQKFATLSLFKLFSFFSHAALHYAAESHTHSLSDSMLKKVVVLASITHPLPVYM